MRVINIILAGVFLCTSVYADTQLEALKDLGDFFQIYVVQKDQRHRRDQVEVKRNRGGYMAEISYWRSLKSRNPQEEICNAFRWLFLGRGESGNGVDQALSKFPSLNQVILQFYDIKFGTRAGKKLGDIVPVQKAIPYIRVGLTRNRQASNKANLKRIHRELNRKNCGRTVRKYVDLAWFNENYLRQAK